MDLKHFDGYKMLKDLVTSLQKLVVEVTIKVDNVEKTFFGILVCGFGDTPAAQALGGFKEGVGASLSPCRTCNISRQHISTVLLHEQCLCHTSEEHLYRVQCLEYMSDADQFHWSKLWGINKRSILMNIPHFDVTSCILHDPMHVLLEGMCKVEVKKMLYYFVYIKKVFTLAQLNNRINFFEYSSVQMADKQQIIEKKHLQQSATFPQTAASMLILMTSLPFMLFDFDPYLDEHWTNFVHLLQIVLLCTSSEVSSETIYELQHLISSYISVFLKLYPNSSFSPKMHYLIHFPDQIREFGPLRAHWCFRFEGKNVFKQKRWFNFKNLPFSLASHQQRWLCYRMLPNKPFLISDNVPKDIENTTLDEIVVAEYSLTEILNQVDSDSCTCLYSVKTCRSICINNLEYDIGSMLLQGFSEETDLPILLQIEKILLINNATVFCCSHLAVVAFSSALNAFQVKLGIQKTSLCYSSLKCKWVQIIHTCNRVKYVMLHHTDRVWLL